MKIKMRLNWTLRYILIIELLNIFFLIEALKVGEKGVCTVMISVQKIRSKWVTINKRCGKKNCRVKKTEKYSVPQQKTICCSGWEYISNDSCTPVCQPGCQGGRCTAPNECTCDPPSTPHSDQKNICLFPKCDPPCVNANCVNNKCLCKPGFQVYNSTYCSICGPGFPTTEDLECVPTCEEGCPNGKCTAHNECTCDEGYEKNKSNDCIPVCTNPCKNGKCSAPDICTCDEGYQKNGTDCEPICSQTCINSKCTEPGICACLEGYQKNDTNYCTPICIQPCTNGKCTEPDVCICDSGFEKNATNACVPKCTNCENGKCTEPDICTCNTGFTKSVSGLCEPTICDCVNSTCVAPNKCTCFDGFEKLNDTVCVPKCDRCNGFCVGPNVCVCAEGLININGDCKPVCRGCENGHCIGENCVCNEGFVTDGDLKRYVRDCTAPFKVNQTIQKNFPERFSKTKRCPSGYKDCTPKEIKELGHFDPKKFRCCYKRKPVKQEIIACCTGYEYLNKSCHPICKPSCDHGTCIAPDVCQCDPHFAWHDKMCIPSVCNPSCGTNTICTDDTCNCEGDTIPYNTTHCVQKCDLGYNINNDSLVCEPHCESGCQNGTCVSPNTCECNGGYKLEENRCSPVCEQCENGVCLAPNNCQCNEGYLSINNSCIPVCSDCVNGECIAPNVCQCNEPNYTKHGNGSCIPVCAEGCVNADCTAPNICTCHSGYEKIDQHNSFECQPICDPKCINATCVSPNNCNCFDGYEKTGNEWTCAFKCDEGYVRNSSDPLICYKPCEGPCEFGVCTRDGICECKAGYELVNDSCSLCDPKCINATCASPNNCKCFDGYEKIENEWTCALKCAEGYVRNSSDPLMCYKPCKGPCDFGVCTQDGVCVCKGSYELVNDTCSPLPPVDCNSCVHNCSNGECWCLDGRACTSRSEVGAEVTSPGLATMELTWGLGGTIVVLLLALVLGVMCHLYRRRRTDTNSAKSDPYGSVVSTVPDTLLTQRCSNLEIAREVNKATEANKYEAHGVNGKNPLLCEECEV